MVDASFKDLFKGTGKQPAKRTKTRAERRSWKFDRFRPSDDQPPRDSDDADLVRHKGDNVSVHDVIQQSIRE